MERPRIRHIAINVVEEEREKLADYYKQVFGMEEKYRGPSGAIYLSDGFVDLALITAARYAPGIHHFGFQVESIKAVEEASHTSARSRRELQTRCSLASRKTAAIERYICRAMPFTETFVSPIEIS